MQVLGIKFFVSIGKVYLRLSLNFLLLIKFLTLSQTEIKLFINCINQQYAKILNNLKPFYSNSQQNFLSFHPAFNIILYFISLL